MTLVFTNMAPSRSGPAPLITCWMLLLAVLVSTAHATRFLTAFQQSFDSGASNPQMIRAELVHRDHPDSPLAPAEGTTLADRWAAAVKRSDNLIASRGRRLADFQTPVTHINGFLGDYIMSISFGTPPQKFLGLVDTGSSLVWVQCAPCPGCSSFPQPDLAYDPTSSSSGMDISCSDPRCKNYNNHKCSATNTCRIRISYTDGSESIGTLMTESITLSMTAGTNPETSGFIMGCMNNNSGSTFENYDGIVGFGLGIYSLPSQLRTLAYLPVFSYCLVPFAATTTNISSMLFGRTSDPNKPLIYTPLLHITGRTQYFVNMTGISVNKVALDIPASVFEYKSANDIGGVFLDSGNTITRFSPRVYTAFRQAVASLLPYPIVTIRDRPERLCFDISGVAAPVYPKVKFHFGSEDGLSVVDFDLADENTFGPYTNTEGVSCLAFRPSTAQETVSIGNVQQANHYIETDVVKMRLGWMTQDCTV